MRERVRGEARVVSVAAITGEVVVPEMGVDRVMITGEVVPEIGVDMKEKAHKTT
jgi:hypothetical protein